MKRWTPLLSFSSAADNLDGLVHDLIVAQNSGTWDSKRRRHQPGTATMVKRSRGMPEPLERLFICYVPALDARRIQPHGCPFVASLFADYPSAMIRTLPAIDHVPTLLTGTWPHEHGLWGPRLKANGAVPSPAQRVVDLMPDLVTTTAQGLVHLMNGPVELATMPPRRRRRFDLMRFKFIKYVTPEKVVMPLNGTATMFTALGSEHCRFGFHNNYWRLGEQVERVANGDVVLEMAEIHCLDDLQHWHLDDEEVIAAGYRAIDDFMAKVCRKCRQNGVGLLLLCDHGMERVERVVDLRAIIDAERLPPEELDFFVEATRATFWFHSDRARERIMTRLASCTAGVVVRNTDLRRYNIDFADDAYGEVYFYATPGCSFCPSDFHQPIANLVSAFLERQSRPRLKSPHHRGDHGYLPEHPSERGFVILVDDGCDAPDDEATLIDIAPTVLSLLGGRPPESMKGRRLFRPRTAVT
jgi:Type I phosphodiesterase / nucleotide pyrophosphatase